MNEDKIIVKAVYSNIINFAMQQNYVPIIRNLTIENLTDLPLEKVTIKISSEPSFLHRWERTIDVIPAKEIIDVGVINLILSPEYLLQLTERISGVLSVEISSNNEIIKNINEDIDILAYDEWSGTAIMPELITAFVTPNHPCVTQVIIKASEVLKKWTGSPSFTGYQSNNTNTIRLQMAAIYTALQNENIAYSMPPASFEIIGQRVRMCDEVISQKLGTCLDLSILYVSCLEAVGLNPMFIFIEGHAFIGCWLENQCFSEVIQDDISQITKRIAEGIYEICLVECTAYVAGKKIEFDQAVKAAEGNLVDSSKFQIAIDVKRTRGSGIRPIPQRRVTKEGFEIYKTTDVEKENNKTAKPKELEIIAKIQEVEKVAVTRQQLWERKLLDLSLRNMLINFRVTKNAIQLMATGLSEIEDALADGEELQVLGKPQGLEETLMDAKIYEIENKSSIIEDLLHSEFESRRIRTFMTEQEVSISMTNLYRQAKVSLEENGTNTLYLALGFLKWYESDISEKARYAPIVLIPIDIVHKSAKKGYIIRPRDEEPQMNITLLEMLRQDFNLSIGGLDPLPLDQSGVDLKGVFSIIRQAVMSKSRWDVDEVAFIGLFSFKQFIMWNDIKNRKEELKRNKVVSSLISGKMEWVPEHQMPKLEKLDELFAPEDIALPISADSSQLSAICAAGQDNSFVLHGPPGTGKSQTITNIISNALFQGKTVLFIAEKMAALSVVQKRLESILLGPFCLELHSNKAKKKDVLEQLQKVLEIGRLAAPKEYSENAERLAKLRKELNEHNKGLHKVQNTGFSIYDAISRFEQYENNKDCVQFDVDKIKELTPQKFNDFVEIIREMVVISKESNGAYGNPFSNWNLSNYSPDVKQEIEKVLAEYKIELEEIKDKTNNFSALIETPIKSLSQLEKACNIAKLIEKIELIPSELLKQSNLGALENDVIKVVSIGRKYVNTKAKILETFLPQVIDTDEVTMRNQWQKAENSWFLPKILGQNKIIKQLKVLVNNNKDIDKQNILGYLNAITEIKECKSEINKVEMKQLFGSIWNAENSNWTELEVVYEQAKSLQHNLMDLTSNLQEYQKVRDIVWNKILIEPELWKKQNLELLNTLVNINETVASYNKNLNEIGKIDFSIILKEDNFIETMTQNIKLWLDNLDKLRSWCSYINIRNKAKNAGLESLIRVYEEGKVSEDELLPAFYRGIYHDSVEYFISQEPSLANFQGVVFEEKIKMFKETSNEFEKLTCQELVQRLSSKIPVLSSGAANSSEIGILQKAIKSNGRMLPIRKLFDSIPNLLRTLCPCMLMSPISVSQYIDPSYPEFDLVVIDEASQMPTSEAVGAIARGKNVIVVGDPKQLPPTSFFSGNQFDEDNYENEDLESILDDCLALSMPQEHLKWHYRSKHESLIAFSNMKYYENKLFTFPSPNDLVSMVKLVDVKGFYDRGKTKHNRAEAEEVIAEIIRRLEDSELRKDSIGVVTFSSVQKNLIDDLLNEAFLKRPDLEEINNKSDEPIFIKNLENVQGDERDVILFSIGYGPDENGKVTLNFGPLNREGGWRRLNVAVSRARKEMKVFSVLKPEQIDLTKTRSEGIVGIKSFLEFAKKGKKSLVSIANGKHNISCEAINFIAERIRNMGYEVSTNVGCSEYKIDIAIVDKEDKGNYILGIMCDGMQYSKANTCRDRHLLQDSVLRSLGWNIHRIWMMDWWENHSRELKRIEESIEKAMKSKGENPKIETVKATKIQYEKINTQETLINEKLNEVNIYQIASLNEAQGTAEDFYLPQNNNNILKRIETIIEIEAPISKRLLGKRLLLSFGITRMGARIDRRISELLSMATYSQSEYNGVTYYWNKNQEPISYDDFRVPEENGFRRDMEDIAPEEISNAVNYILVNQIGLPSADLVKEVSKLFGYTRNNSNNEAMINEGIQVAIKRGYARKSDGDRIVKN